MAFVRVVAEGRRRSRRRSADAICIETSAALVSVDLSRAEECGVGKRKCALKQAAHVFPALVRESRNPSQYHVYFQDYDFDYVYDT